MLCQVPTITALYTEAHCISHARTRLQGDEFVNNALNSKIERESQLKRTKSTVMIAEKHFIKAVNYNSAQGEIPMFGPGWEKEERQFRNDIKNQIKTNLQVETQEELDNHAKTLVQQGHFLCLAESEKSHAVWKSYLYNLKHGTMKFLLNSVIDTLPTGANLTRWNKSSSDKCKLCKNRETTLHILNGCKKALNDGRYTWRHNSIINYITSCLDNSKYVVRTDLPGNPSKTLPPEMIVTNLIPDVVIVDEKKKNVAIFELTAPFETNIKARHEQKSDKYAHFVTDITTHKAEVEAFEIGSRGYISPDNESRLKKLHKFCKPDVKFKTFRENISVLSFYCSFHIFLCRKDMDWTAPPYLKQPFSAK